MTMFFRMSINPFSGADPRANLHLQVWALVRHIPRWSSFRKSLSKNRFLCQTNRNYTKICCIGKHFMSLSCFFFHDICYSVNCPLQSVFGTSRFANAAFKRWACSWSYQRGRLIRSCTFGKSNPATVPSKIADWVAEFGTNPCGQGNIVTCPKKFEG